MLITQCRTAPVRQLPICKGYAGRGRMGDWGAPGQGHICCLSMEDQHGFVLLPVGFGAGVCPGLFTREPVPSYSPDLQRLRDVGVCRWS